MPSISDNYGPAGQSQIAAWPDIDNVIQGCPCSLCSRIRYNPQTARRAMEYQHPYENQTLGGSYPPGVAAAMDGPSQVWSVAPQAPVCCQILCSLCLAKTLALAGSRERWVCTLG